MEIPVSRCQTLPVHPTPQVRHAVPRQGVGGKGRSGTILWGPSHGLCMAASMRTPCLAARLLRCLCGLYDRLPFFFPVLEPKSLLKMQLTHRVGKICASNWLESLHMFTHLDNKLAHSRCFCSLNTCCVQRRPWWQAIFTPLPCFDASGPQRKEFCGGLTSLHYLTTHCTVKSRPPVILFFFFPIMGFSLQFLLVTFDLRSGILSHVPPASSACSHQGWGAGRVRECSINTTELRVDLFFTFHVPQFTTCT